MWRWYGGALMSIAGSPSLELRRGSICERVDNRRRMSNVAGTPYPDPGGKASRAP